MKNIIFIVCFFCFISPAFSGDADPVSEAKSAEQPQEMPRVVMARVGDQEITVEQFMHFLVRNPGRVKDATTLEGKADLLRILIGNKLLNLAVRDEGFLPDNPSQADFEKALLELEGRYFPLPPKPEEAEIRAYYDEHRQEFGIPASVRLSHIHLGVENMQEASEEVKKKVRARAEEALKRIESGEPFSEVAVEYTENPIAKKHNGDVGFVTRYGDPWLEKALENLKVGEHTGILESRFGYDILLVTDAREAMISTFDEVREDLSERMRQEQQMKKRMEYMRRLADKYQVEIVLDELIPAFSQGVFPRDE